MARELKPCGTVAAYNRHRLHEETTCPECRKAVRDYIAERRRRQYLERYTEQTDGDVIAVRELLRALDRVERVVGALAIGPSRDAVRKRFAVRIEEITEREKDRKRARR